MKHRLPEFSRRSAIVIVFLAAGCGGLSEREEILFSKGQAAVSAQDWSAAAEHLDAVVTSAPDFIPAYLLRGRALFELQRYENALLDLDRAVSSGELIDEESFAAIQLRGRSYLELGRKILPDSELRSTEGEAETRKRARDLFLKANLSLLEAANKKPEDYEANLWRGFALHRLENYRKALELFTVCERLASHRWEHRFFTALSWEGLYKINKQSLDTYLALAAQGPTEAMAPLYEHIATLAPDVEPETSRQLLKAVESFALKVPNHSESITAYLQRSRAQRDAEMKTLKMRELTEAVAILTEKGRFSEAVERIEAHMKAAGESPEAIKLLKEAQESWSLRLELATESLAANSDRKQLGKAVQDLELARTLTSKVDRLVTLQQKLTQAQISLNRSDASRKIQAAFDLYRNAQYQAVLDQTAATDLDSMDDADRDRYHYLRGASSYALGQWTASVRAFTLLNQRNFEGIDLLHGMALVRSGQEAAGIALLENLPSKSRNDEANGVLGLHFASRGELRKATSFFSTIKSPRPADLEVHLNARRELGKEYYRQGDYARAVEELQVARQIAEAQLHRRAMDIYLYLGNSYFRLEELDRAKKAYEDLTRTDLTRAEREQCRELFLYRAQIHLREKSPDLAYADLAELVKLGGEIPPELTNAYSRLLATYADFFPLDQIQYWNYVSTTKDYNYTLFVKSVKGGDRIVERREAGTTSSETWSRQGIVLTKAVGENIIKLPINSRPGEEAPPFLEYTSRGQACTSEIVAVGQTVETVNGRKFADCLKIRLTRKQESPEGVKYYRHIYYLAPNIGEVKQEIFWDDRKVSEIVLSDFALRSANPGN